MNGLVTFISGGASGLGRATVNRFAKKGAKVVFCDLPTSDGVAVAKKIGENATYVPADVTNDQDVLNVMTEIRKKYGKLNVVVNCAGIGNAHVVYNFNTQSPRHQDDFEKVLKTNVMGTLNVIRHSVDLIIENKPDINKWRGVIVNTAGIEGIRGTHGQSSVAAASGAIIAMTKTMADDFLAQGIRVVTISPGLFRTPLFGELPPLIESAVVNERVIAPNRLGHPNEYAHLVETCVCNPALNGISIELAGGVDLN